MYRFRDMVIEGKMFEAMERYIKHGIIPGDFLQAVIANDLFLAVGRADKENERLIPAYVVYFYNKAPDDCHGSKEIMIAYSAKKQKEREESEK